MRSSLVLLTMILAATACGGHQTPTARDATPATGDAAPSPGDTAIDRHPGAEVGLDGQVSILDGAAACAGSTNHAVVNGVNAAPAVRASMIPTDCCDEFVIQLDSATFVSSIYVSLLITATNSPLPATVDLATPQPGLRVLVSTDCDSRGSNCQERYTTGFTGTLQSSLVEGRTTLSLCLQVADADGSHTRMRTLELALPHVEVR